MVLAEQGLTPALGLRPREAPTPPGPHLFRVLDAGNPLIPGSRHDLTDLDQVLLGRSVAVACAREASQRQLVLGVPDPWMSGRHAVLRKAAGGWTFTDLDSTNGSHRNGVAAREGVLLDGDLLELGHTAFVFRDPVPRRAGAPPDLDGANAVAAEGLVTLLPALEAEHARLATLARSSVGIVLGGETGVGKEVMARAIHGLSGRTGPFLAINCGALPPGLVESELFGHKKGAFSGATEDRPGLVRAAEGGSLLLDEIGEMPPAAQAALLRVLQEGEVHAIGASRPTRVDVRVLAATHKDLDTLVAQGTFRADLLARLSGFTARLLPLRERREDLGLLIGSLLRAQLGERAAKVRFTPEAIRALFVWRWPLNVRELGKCLGAACVLAGDEPIDVQHLPKAMQIFQWSTPTLTPAPSTNAERAAIAVETPGGPEVRQRPLTEDEARHREEVLALLKEHRGNVAAISRAVGKARMQVTRWLRRYGLDPQDFRD